MSEKTSTFLSSVKIISVLLIICVVCGALLALCNDIFYVDEATKFNRSMKKVYPNFERDTTVSETPIAEFKDLAGVGNVSKVYRSKDGTYILEATGFGGFSNGTVTMYVAIGGQAPNVTIKSLIITDNVGQSWIAKVGQKDLDKAYVGKAIKDIANVQFGADYKLGGTTYTSTAILNAVKSAVNYCVTALKLVTTPESEARDAVAELLGDGYEITTVVDEIYTSALGVNFYFTATKEGADGLDVYVAGDKESGYQIVAVKAGLKHAERLEDSAVVATSEGIDNALVEKVQGLSQLESQIRQSAPNFTYDADGELGDLAKNDQFSTAEIASVYKSDSGTMAIVVKAIVGDIDGDGYAPGEISLMVIIADNKIAAWNAISLGGHSYFDMGYANKEQRAYYGASIGTIIPAEIATGASESGQALYDIINLAAYYARSGN